MSEVHAAIEKRPAPGAKLAPRVEAAVADEDAIRAAERPTRRHVRVRCALKIGDRELHGFSSNVSANGFYLRIPQSEVSAGPGGLGPEWRPGTEVRLTFTLPRLSEALSVSARIVWLNAGDRDIGGRAVLGVGLRLLDLDARQRAQLLAFVENFRYTVLLVAERSTALLQAMQVLGEDYRVIRCASAREALRRLEQEDVGVLITDHDASDISAVEFLKRVADLLPHAHLIRVVMSEAAENEQLQQFVNVGKIFYYLRKPFDRSTLVQVVRRAVDAHAMAVENERLNAELERANRRLTRENAYLRQRVAGGQGFEHIIGNSDALREALSQVERIRRTDATVHIQGDTGTGKELIARALHFGGVREDGPFVAQNCGGLTEALLQSTLFGHRKGAFTGADRDRAGVFQEADGGTLFLDEVAELSPAMQTALLRALQQGEIMPVGATRPVKVNVRVVSATHKDLRRETQAGRFREDLYFRLVVISVRLPALSERGGDIPLLARHFLDLMCERYGKDLRGFATDAMQALCSYPWPGNVRELENEIERLVVLCSDGATIRPRMLSSHISAAQASLDGDALTQIGQLAGLTFDQALENLQRLMVTEAMDRSGGVVSRAAELLGMDRTRLSKLRRRLSAKQSN